MSDVKAATHSSLVGLNKKEALEKLKLKQTWPTHEMVSLINGLKVGLKQDVQSMQKVSVGDVYYHKIFKHPVLIIGIRKSLTMGVCLTSSESDICIGKTESRFFPDQFISKAISFNHINEVRGNFLSVFDNKKKITEIRNIFSNELKTFRL